MQIPHLVVAVLLTHGKGLDLTLNLTKPRCRGIGWSSPNNRIDMRRSLRAWLFRSEVHGDRRRQPSTKIINLSLKLVNHEPSPEDDYGAPRDDSRLTLDNEFSGPIHNGLHDVFHPFNVPSPAQNAQLSSNPHPMRSLHGTSLGCSHHFGPQSQLQEGRRFWAQRARIRIDPDDQSILPEERIDPTRVDATTEAETAAPERKDEAIQDMTQYARRIQRQLGLSPTDLARPIDVPREMIRNREQDRRCPPRQPPPCFRCPKGAGNPTPHAALSRATSVSGSSASREIHVPGIN